MFSIRLIDPKLICIFIFYIQCYIHLHYYIDYMRYNTLVEEIGHVTFLESYLWPVLVRPMIADMS